MTLEEISRACDRLIKMIEEFEAEMERLQHEESLEISLRELQTLPGRDRDTEVP